MYIWYTQRKRLKGNKNEILLNQSNVVSYIILNWILYVFDGDDRRRRVVCSKELGSVTVFSVLSITYIGPFFVYLLNFINMQLGLQINLKVNKKRTLLMSWFNYKYQKWIAKNTSCPKKIKIKVTRVHWKFNFKHVLNVGNFPFLGRTYPPRIEMEWKIRPFVEPFIQRKYMTCTRLFTCAIYNILYTHYVALFICMFYIRCSIASHILYKST